MDAGKHVSGAVPGARAQRATPRLKVFQPTEMRIGRERTRVHILDLSASGALVHHPEPPATGELAWIDCVGAPRPARVIRRDGDRLGLQFLAPLTASQLAEAISG